MSSATAAGEPSPLDLLREPEFLTLTAVRFVTGLAFATVIIALALYADLFEASGVVAGLFGTAYAAVRLLVVLPMGRRIDIGNSKRWLLGGLGLNVLLLVGFSLVGSIEHVVALRGLQALGATVLWVTGAAVVGEIAPDGDRGLWIGTYNQAQSVGSLGGDLLGGALLFVYGFGTTYAVLIVLTLAVTAAVVVLVRDDPGTRSDPEEATGLETFGRLIKRRAVLALVAFRFGFSFGKMAVVIFLPIYARTEFGMSALLIGGILAGGKLTKGVAQGYVGGYADRVGSMHWFVLAGTLGYALGTALIPAAGVAAGVFPSVSLAGPWGELTLVPAFFALFLAYSVLGRRRQPPHPDQHGAVRRGGRALRRGRRQPLAPLGLLAGRRHRRPGRRRRHARLRLVRGGVLGRGRLHGRRGAGVPGAVRGRAAAGADHPRRRG
ncbi:MAG: MFS transporter [Halobacteriales archaeon]|nr:MFS transporter [Halobacteriales archaeon]